MKNVLIIELIAITAVIAILLGIIRPLYNQHITKTKLASVKPIVDRLVQEAITYANMHGRFPRTNQLGLETANNIQTVGANRAVSPDGVNTYALSLLMADQDNGKTGIVSGTLTGSVLRHRNSSTIAFKCLLAQNDEAIDSKCVYSYGLMGYPEGCMLPS